MNEFLTRQERKALKREEQQSAMRQEHLKRRFLGGFVWFLVIAVIVGGFAAMIWYSKKRVENLPGQEFSILGRQHIAFGAPHGDYNSNPPTSGPHYDRPADWGVYDTELPDEQLIHNLEHGGIWISYKDIDAETKKKLEELAKDHPQSVVMAPRAKNDSKIAFASWGRVQKFEQFDEDAMELFIDVNINRSPEPLAR